MVARVVQEPVDDAIQALGFLHDEPHELGLVPVLGLLAQHLGRARDRGQGIANLVRHAGGELTERGQLLGAAHRALHHAQLAEVGDGHHHALGHAVLPGKRCDRHADRTRARALAQA